MNHKCTLAILSAILLTSCRTNPNLPPNPTGLKPHYATKSQKSITTSTRPLAETIPTFSITNIIVLGGQVSISWNDGTSPYQVEGEPILAGPWSTIGPVTMRHSATFPQDQNNFFRVQGAINLLNITTNPTTLNWTPPQLDMPDTLTDNKIQRRYDQPTTGNGLVPNDDTGWTDLATVPAGQDYVDTGSGADPTQHPLIIYREREVTANGVFIPVGPTSISGTAPPASGKMDWVRELVAAQSLFILPVITTDFLGNVIVAGAAGSPVNFGNGEVGVSANSAAFIAKYATDNTLLWALPIGNTVSLASIQGVVTDSLGNIFVAGTFAAANATPMDFGGITKSTGSSSTSNIFVAKYGPGAPNSPPTALWVKQYGVGGSIKSQGIAIDNSDNPTIVAYYQSPVDFGGGPIGGAFFNLIILRVSSLDGSTLLAKPFGGGAGVWQNLSISTNPQGTSIGISGLISSGNNDFGAGTTTGQFFAKYSGTTGNLVWSKQPTNLGLCVTAIDPVTDNFYVSGGFTTGIDFGGGPSHIDNPDHGGVFIVAFDAGGNWKWNKFAGEEGNIAYAIATDGNNVYICGQGASMDWGRTGIVAGGNGYFLAYFKVNGTFNLLKFSTGSYPSTGHSVAVDKTLNKVFGCGYFSTSPITLDGIVLPANGSDGFIAKYEP